MTSKWNIECDTKPDEGPEPSKVIVTNKADSTSQYSFMLRYIHGIPSPSSCNTKRWENLDSRIKYKPSDIIISTYPKCGTTWTEQVVLLLLNGGDPELMDPSHKNIFQPGTKFLSKMWPEAAIEQDPMWGTKAGKEFATISMEDFDTAVEPRVIKTHQQASLLLGCGRQCLKNLPEGTKTIIVNRNPLDACVSCYYHAFNPYKSGWPFDAWASVWLAGNISFGSWFDWVKSWYTEVQSNPGRALWLHYEDMQKDARGEIAKIATYLDLLVTEELLDKVVLHSSFDSMKQQAAAKGGDAGGHLRKGKSGDWRNHFSDEMLAEYRAHYAREMAGTGLVFSIGDDADPLTA